MKQLLALLILASTCAAQAARLDDSLSPQQSVDADVDWLYHNRLEKLDAEQLNALVSRVHNIEVRLNTTAQKGKQARIYLALPLNIRGLDEPAGMRLGWTTHGVFLDGTVTPGTRALLYDGTISSDVMVDILDFTIDIDGRIFSGPVTFEPAYEIEITTP